jgi:hypothetical protein
MNPELESMLTDIASVGADALFMKYLWIADFDLVYNRLLSEQGKA